MKKEKPDSSIRAVVFDVDGVLVDSEPFICEAACRMFVANYGAAVQPEDFLPFVGTGEGRYIGGVAEKYGIKLDLPRDKASIYDIYLEIIRGRLQPVAGVHDFLARCRDRGLKLALATSADEVKLLGNLKEINLTPDDFDACVNGLEITHKKPHPEVFLLAAKRLDLPPRQCLVVEDAINGVQAARAAGAKCLGLTTSFSAEKLLAAGADFIAADFNSVPPEALGD